MLEQNKREVGENRTHDTSFVGYIALPTELRCHVTVIYFEVALPIELLSHVAQ